MRKCEYCGSDNEEDATRCIKCRREFLIPTAELHNFVPRPLDIKKHFLMVCGVYPQGFAPRQPFFGAVSIFAPLAGLLIGFVVFNAVQSGGDMGGLAKFTYFLAIVLLSLVLGGISALIGLSRGEKHRALSFVGLVVDFGPVVAFFLNRCLQSAG
jgi:hypothetical protein